MSNSNNYFVLGNNVAGGGVHDIEGAPGQVITIPGFSVNVGYGNSIGREEGSGELGAFGNTWGNGGGGGRVIENNGVNTARGRRRPWLCPAPCYQRNTAGRDICVYCGHPPPPPPPGPHRTRTTNVLHHPYQVPGKNNPTVQGVQPSQIVPPGKKDFLLTTRKIALFANRKDPHPLPTDRIVYVDGTFDIFHPGHLAFLREARKLGDYVIVGLHDDKTAALTSESEENKLPIMNLQERAMNVLANRYVDEIVLGAPYSVSKELLEHLKVNVVAHGIATSVVMDPETGKDPYEVPKSDGIFQEIDSGSSLTTQQVMDRAKRNKEKQKCIDDTEQKEAERCRAMQAED